MAEAREQQSCEVLQFLCGEVDNIDALFEEYTDFDALFQDGYTFSDQHIVGGEMSSQEINTAENKQSDGEVLYTTPEKMMALEHETPFSGQGSALTQPSDTTAYLMAPSAGESQNILSIDEIDFADIDFDEIFAQSGFLDTLSLPETWNHAETLELPDSSPYAANPASSTQFTPSEQLACSDSSLGTMPADCASADQVDKRFGSAETRCLNQAPVVRIRQVATTQSGRRSRKQPQSENINNKDLPRSTASLQVNEHQNAGKISSDVDSDSLIYQMLPYNRRQSNGVENDLLVPKPRLYGGIDSKRTWVKTNPNQGKNTRPLKIESYKPEEIYTPLDRPPRTWGPSFDDARAASFKPDTFRYELTGELERGKYYYPGEILAYLKQNPNDLILWIQRLPADSARRYPNPTSSKCRFETCPMLHNTINQGHVRVCFDELSGAHPNHDPMHNAGYVHLYCLEKFLDFPKICKDLDVRVENRKLPKEIDGKNRMLLSTTDERECAERFIKMCKNGSFAIKWSDYPHFASSTRTHNGTLTHALMKAKYQNYEDQKKYRITQAQERGCSVGWLHMGDLELEVRAREQTRRRGQELRRMRDEKNRGSVDEMDDNDEEDDDPDSLFVPEAEPNTRSSKRKRNDNSENESCRSTRGNKRVMAEASSNTRCSKRKRNGDSDDESGFQVTRGNKAAKAGRA